MVGYCAKSTREGSDDIRDKLLLDGRSAETGFVFSHGVIFGVPQEVYDMFMKKLFRFAYVPGRVIPSDIIHFDGYDYFADTGFYYRKSGALR